MLLLVVMAILLQIYGRRGGADASLQDCDWQGIPPARDPPRPLALRRGTILIVAIPFIVVLIPLANIVWAALLPFYQPFSFAALSKSGLCQFCRKC